MATPWKTPRWIGGLSLMAAAVAVAALLLRADSGDAASRRIESPGRLSAAKTPVLRASWLRLELPDQCLDFGEVVQGDPVDADVVFSNDSDLPLRIERVISGCGCLEATLRGKAQELAPGERGQLRVSLDSSGREGPLSVR